MAYTHKMVGISDFDEPHRSDLMTLLQVLLVLPFGLDHPIDTIPLRFGTPYVIDSQFWQHLSGEFLVKENLLAHNFQSWLHLEEHTKLRARSGVGIELKFEISPETQRETGQTHVDRHFFWCHVLYGGAGASFREVKPVDRPCCKVRVIVIPRNPDREIVENGLRCGKFRVLPRK